MIIYTPTTTSLTHYKGPPRKTAIPHIFTIGLFEKLAGTAYKVKRHIHWRISSSKCSTSKSMAIVIEEETIKRSWHFLRQFTTLFLLRLHPWNPFLHFRFTHHTWRLVRLIVRARDRGHLHIAVQLIPTTNQYMEWLLCVLCEKIHPHGIISRLETRSAEVVWVHTRRETVALDWHWQLNMYMRGESWRNLRTEWAAQRIFWFLPGTKNSNCWPLFTE